jgi:hypothetical protein
MRLLLLTFFAAAAHAQPGFSQARLQDDCLQRLAAIVPREARVAKVDFSALGNYATYYVVSYRFSAPLQTGRATAACTYRRDGQWVGDDAAALKMRMDLEPRR